MIKMFKYAIIRTDKILPAGKKTHNQKSRQIIFLATDCSALCGSIYAVYV